MQHEGRIVAVAGGALILVVGALLWRGPGPRAGSLTAAPRAPARTRPAPSVVAVPATAPIPPRAVPPVVSTPRPAPAPPVTQTVDTYPDPPQMAANPDHPQEPSPFRELPSDQEMPEIRVIDQRDLPEPVVEVYVGPGGRYELRMQGREGRVRVQAGEYRFAIYGHHYHRTGEADQVGTITCRRFHRYELTLVLVNGPTPEVHLGDPR